MSIEAIGGMLVLLTAVVWLFGVVAFNFLPAHKRVSATLQRFQ